MDIIDAKTRPSKRLTKKIGEWYATEQQRKEAAQTMRAYEANKDELTGKILGYIGKGFTPEPGSDYGVVVLEQSSRVAYEGLYQRLIHELGEKYPQYARVFKEAGAKLEWKAREELELKRTVVCDENSKLEALVKRTEKAWIGAEDRKTAKDVKMVVYT